MTKIYEHVLNRAAHYAHRAKAPVVAWDMLGAEKWSKQLKQLAELIEGKSETEALEYLKSERDTLRFDGRSAWGVVTSLEALHRLDELIDPIAKDRVGWIVITTHGGLDNGKLSTRPVYRRMLGTNHCVAHCGRELAESDAAWLARREAWLSKYHPDIKVIRDRAAWSEGAQYTSIVGTVAEVRAIRHLVEYQLTEGAQLLRRNGFAQSLRVIHAGPLDRNDGVGYLAKSVPEDGEQAISVGSIVNTKYGRCAIVD